MKIPPGEYIVKGCEVNVLLSLVSRKDWRELERRAQPQSLGIPNIEDCFVWTSQDEGSVCLTRMRIKDESHF